jgi:hypothetical protein
MRHQKPHFYKTDGKYAYIFFMIQWNDCLSMVSSFLPKLDQA